MTIHLKCQAIFSLKSLKSLLDVNKILWNKPIMEFIFKDWNIPFRYFVQMDKSSYYAFQYSLDFGADVTQDSCLTAAKFRSIAAHFDQKPSTNTSN